MSLWQKSVPCRDHKVCINCGGPHSAAYMNCPKLKIEGTIQKDLETENLSYIEAKRKVNIQTPKANILYASAVVSIHQRPQLLK